MTSSSSSLTPGLWSGADRTDRVLWGISVACGIVYLFLASSIPYPLRVVVKALPVGTMAVIAFRRRGTMAKPREASLLGAALSFSCLGDIFLALRGDYFVQGLSAFLVAHLTYIALFTKNWQRPLRPRPVRLAQSVTILLYSLFFSQWLAPSLGKLAAPVMLYVCAITIMVVSSLWANFKSPWIGIGAILFLISDSIIAAGKFKMDVPYGAFLIWATYYLGQYGIAFGFMREKSGESGNR